MILLLRASGHDGDMLRRRELNVAHHGSLSFNNARDDLLARNLKLVEKLHPGYLAAIDAFIEKTRSRLSAMTSSHVPLRLRGGSLATHRDNGHA